MTAKRSAAVRAKRLARGTPVVWPYRGTHGHGHVVGIASQGTTADNTRYRVRQVDNHVSDSGSRETPIVIHTGAALTPTTDDAVRAAAKRARARHK